MQFAAARNMVLSKKKEKDSSTNLDEVHLDYKSNVVDSKPFR